MKQPLANIMRELTASAQFRKAKSEMMKLHRSFSPIRHVMLFNPSQQTVEMLQTEGFLVTKTKIVEYNQYKVEW